MSGETGLDKPGPIEPGPTKTAAPKKAARRVSLRALLALFVVVVGLKVVMNGLSAISGPPAPSNGSLIGSWSGPSADPLPFSVPVRVRVPSVGINAPLIKLGTADGAVDVPPMSALDEAGWFSGNPTPGEKGSAIIVGHVDTAYGRSVFYPLGNAQPGDYVYVDRSDKKQAAFRITSVEVIDKDQFPADRVYGEADRPELRLITCGGAFDGKHYKDNLVVYATMVKQ